jgi:predicted permease
LLSRIAALFRRRRLDRDLDGEIAFHLAMQEREFRDRGMGAAAARSAALREFGGVSQTRETYRDRRGLPWLETAGRDLRYALRGLARNRGFAAAAVLSLALGIGANTAVFSLFHTLLLRRLPVANPQELVLLYRTGAWGRGYASYPFYLDVDKRSDLFEGVLARSGTNPVPFQAGAADRPESVARERVSGNYFQVLGIQPALGRVFTDDDNRTPNAHPLAILSYDFWQRRFGGDPAVLGRTVTVAGKPRTIVGVAGRGFAGIEIDCRTELWEPAMMMGPNIKLPGAFWSWIVARRRPEVPVARMQAAIDVLFQQHLKSAFGSNKNEAFRKTAMSQRIVVRDAGIGISQLRENFAGALRVLMAAVVLVLLAACANVANLLLARNAAREREMALRYSLGATRGRLVRQAFTESGLLAAAGAALGIAFAYWGERAILTFLPAGSAHPFDPAPNGIVLAFCVAISVGSALLFGLAPALRAAAVDPARGLRPARAHGHAWRPTLRGALVAAQVAFSVVLVALAGLFGHSLESLRSVDLGFRNRSLTAFSVDFPQTWDAPTRLSVRRRLIDRMHALPGVSQVSYAIPGPFQQGWSNMSMRVPGSAIPDIQWVNVQYVSPGYLEALGSVLLAGRDLEPADADTHRRVVVVNEAFVRHFFPDKTNVLGRLLAPDESKPISESGLTIVGVVRDMAHQGLREKPAPTVYRPYLDDSDDLGPAILLRTDAPPAALLPALRHEIRELAPQMTFTDPKTIAERVDDSIFEDRLLATLGAFFGGLALLLAGIGLYGVVAYGTVRRASEIGVRMALGARRAAVVRLVIADALALVAAGLAVGLPVSLLAGRAVGALLFQVRPADPAAFALTIAVLAVAALGAALLPARRAASLDPARILRHE